MTQSLRILAIGILILLGIGAASALIDDPNTIALLHFNNVTNGSSTIIDERGARWIPMGGMYQTSIAPYASKFGDSAGRFNNSTSSYAASVEYGDYNTLLNDKWTMETWIKPRTQPSVLPQGQCILSISNGTGGEYLYYTYVAGLGWYVTWYAVYGGAGTDVVSSPANLSPWLPTDTWSHVMVSGNSSGHWLYINGTYVGYGARSNINYPSVNTAMMTSSLVGAYFINGTMDEVRVTRGKQGWFGFDQKTPPVAEYTYPYWAYTNAGTYTWTAPAGVTRVMAKIVGGGAGGAAAWSTFYNEGGRPGSFVNITQYPVVPGQGYTIVVGEGGLGGTVMGGAYCNIGVVPSGSQSSAFYQVAPGGVGNTTSPCFPTVRGDAAKGLYGGDFSTSGANGGARGGLGYGGGGGAGGVTPGAGTGGNGASGAVIIMPYGFDANYNYPNFTASPISTAPGSIVNFTDISVINNRMNVVYNWDFGDGTSQTHVSGNTSHVYAYAGSFSVNLTLGGGEGSMYELKENYITVTNSQATTYMVPHTVSFTVTDYMGNELNGVNVSASPQNFTAPDGWLQAYYGVAPGVTLNGTTLNGVTGYDGTWAAPMLGAYRYNITFNKTGVVPTYSMSMYPTLDGYTIRIPLVGQLAQPTPAGNYISYALYNTSNNASAENFTIKFKDTSGGTSVLIYNVTNSSGFYKLNGSIAVAGGVGWNNVTTANVSHGAGESLTVRFSATQSQVGYVNQSLVVTWDNLQTLAGYPSWVGQWLGITVLVLFAGSVSMVNVKYAVVILPVLAYFLVVYTRWLAPVVGLTAFFASLGILLVLGALRYIRDQKGKLGRT